MTVKIFNNIRCVELSSYYHSFLNSRSSSMIYRPSSCTMDFRVEVMFTRILEIPQVVGGRRLIPMFLRYVSVIAGWVLSPDLSVLITRYPKIWS